MRAHARDLVWRAVNAWRQRMRAPSIAVNVDEVARRGCWIELGLGLRLGGGARRETGNELDHCSSTIKGCKYEDPTCTTVQTHQVPICSPGLHNQPANFNHFEVFEHTLTLYFTTPPPTAFCFVCHLHPDKNPSLSLSQHSFSSARPMAGQKSGNPVVVFVFVSSLAAALRNFVQYNSTFFALLIIVKC